MIETKIGDHDYRIEVLDAFDQLHLARKVAPILPKLLAVVPAAFNLRETFKVIKETGIVDSGDMEDLSGVLSPFFDAMADMSKEDVEYIIGLCLKITKRKMGSDWIAAWVNGVLMLGDMDLVTMLTIAWKVIESNLGRYFPTGLLQSPAAEAQQQAG